MVEITGFAVGDEIGRGGFGVVYRARDLSFDRDVAIKVLHDVPGTDLRQRFLTECRAVGSLGGRPGLPTVYSTGVTSAGAPFMAMELLPGGSLSQRQPLPPDAVIDVGRRLAAALQAAHDGGVIHRDVKPANVLFDVDDQPVLVDFGISALVGEPANSESADVAVSVAFAPPEVLAGGHPEVPGDVYALGATLFCALTGRAPFVSTYGYESLAVIASRIATAQVEDLRPLGVPDRLARTIEIAMAKDPAARFPSMALFGAALAEAVPSGAAPDGAAPGGAARDGAKHGANPDGAVAVDSAQDRSTRAAIPAVRRAEGRHPRRALVVTAAASAVLLAGGVTALVLSSGAGTSTVASSGAPSGGSVLGRTSGAPASAGRLRGANGAGVPDNGGLSTGPGGAATDDGTGAPVAGLPGTRARRSGVVAPTTSHTSDHRVGRGAGPGGRTSSSVVPPAGGQTTPSPVTRPSSSAPRPNRAPTVNASGNTWSEKQTVSVPIATGDPDGNAVTLTVSGLPSWLHLSGHTISGVAPYNAATVTKTRTKILTRTFSLKITATDTHKAQSRTTVAVRIRDTLRTMPDYIGKTGAGSPTISAVSRATRSCAYEKKGTGKLIYWQSVRPGTVIAWGKKITYRYGKNQRSCGKVTGHWPR